MARLPFLSKKARLPAGATTMVPLSQVLELLESQNRANSKFDGEHGSKPMETPGLWGELPFGPGSRIPPSAITPLRPDTGRAEAQAYEYPVAWNLQTTQQREIPWRSLRTAASSPLVRPIIRKRAKDLCSLPWDISVKRSVIEEAARESGDGSANAASKLAKSLAPDISRCREFWESPDPVQGYDFADWFVQLIEDQLVLDAVAIYPETTYDGTLFGFRAVDGATIKPLLNELGRRPVAPYPAYQQILYGFPRGEFTADVGIDDPDVYTADQLVYRRQYVRNFSPYGLSPVEPALLDIDLFLKRHGWMRSEYTEGTLAEAYLKTYGETQTQWSPQQLLEYERQLNDSMSGSNAERHRMRMLPPGWEAQQNGDVSERYKSDYDLYIIQLVCSHFGERAERMGFTVGKGALGGSGVAGQADEVSAESGLFPDAKWWMRQFSQLSYKYLGMSKQLEFRFLDVEEEDLGSADEVGQNRVQSGRVTYNEERDRLALPRYTDPLADIPVIVTRKGVQPLTMAGIALGAGVAPPGAPGAPLNADGTANTNMQDEQSTQDAKDAKKQQDVAIQGQQQLQPNAAGNPAHGNAPGVVPALSTKPSRQGEVTPPGGSTSGSSNAASEAARALANHRHAKNNTQAVDSQKDVRAETEIAQSEIRAYKNWIGKNATPSRQFEFESDQMLVRVLDPAVDFEHALFKQKADAPSHATRHDVHSLMQESFPDQAISWVKHTDWSGPQQVNADDIDMSDDNSWAAEHDPAKVDRIAKKMSKGKSVKPMVIIKVRGKNRFITVDGHHHLLGSIKAGVIPEAYVGEIDPQYLQAAMETHTHQFPKPDK
jgi:hypothetical protein